MVKKLSSKKAFKKSKSKTRKNRSRNSKRNKYFKQSGGADEIIVYTFNVLNPDPNVTQMLYKKLDHTDRAELSYIDSKRFYNYDNDTDGCRKTAILDIIDSWLKNPKAIVCLQEVGKNLLDTLTTIYGESLKSTKEKDLFYYKEMEDVLDADGKPKKKANFRGIEQIIKQPKLVDGLEVSERDINGNKKIMEKMSREEYRVTIIGSQLSFGGSEEIPLESELFKKSCLYTQIQIPSREYSFDVFNIHLHWKNTKAENNKFSSSIKEKTIKALGKIPYIICGSFNRTFSDDSISGFKSEDLESITLSGSTDFTSYDTSSKEEYTKAIVDHIIIGNEIKYSEGPQILHTVVTDKAEYEIFYDLDAITDLYSKKRDRPDENNFFMRMNTFPKGTLNEEEKIKHQKEGATRDAHNVKVWCKVRQNKDISDHLPVMAKLAYKY